MVTYPFFIRLLPVACLLAPHLVWAATVTFMTPGGAVSIDVGHAGPSGQLVDPAPPQDAGFRPPTIFAAPLPVGSGARALSQAGAFTAVADDATAASWNPAGLIQLEYPEISAVYRFSDRLDDYESGSERLVTGENDYMNSELNYLSAVYPLRWSDRNLVLSLNYQEAYDFTQEFSAQFSAADQQHETSSGSGTFFKTATNNFSDVYQSLTLVSDVTTEMYSEINQLLSSELLSELDFLQQGSIDAVSPAFAIELNPGLSVGVALNLYSDGANRGNAIRSSLVADYQGTSNSDATIYDTRNSTAIINYFGDRYYGDVMDPKTNAVANSHTTLFSDVTTNNVESSYDVSGVYREVNRTEDFHGVNATLGVLWSAGEKLALGATVDLPWTGHGRQTKQVSHQITAFDSNLVEVASSSYEDVRVRTVEYVFPLYWSAGALWRWSDRLYTSMDVSQTCWSHFSYKAEDEERLNPLNGEPHASSALDDCWSVRLGGEYLCILSSTEIPLRAGVYWEQRPALETPDEYWGLSMGSGISLGKNPGKVVLDVAYIFEWGNEVMDSLLPDRTVYSNTITHQMFFSMICHF